MEHRGMSYYNSCVKVPVDPYSRQPTPSYERPRLLKNERQDVAYGGRKINFVADDQPTIVSQCSSSRETLENFLEFLESIPDYGQVHHLSNEQFKQKVEYLRRKQRLFLSNLKNSLDDSQRDASRLSFQYNENSKSKLDDVNELKLNGKKCYFEESRVNSPLLFSGGTFAGLADDQDFLTYRCKDKETKAILNKEIHSINKERCTLNTSKSDENVNSDTEDSIETKSLPARSSKEWHPTVPRPFSFTLREEAEKYMTFTETEAVEHINQESNKKSSSKKRRVKPIPLTSKMPLYDKLLAEKEERSRIIREESALNLLSQVKPFKLECDRRAWRSLTRSSPEICSKKICSLSRFKAKPPPKNLFSTEVYDRMLEDEYYRHEHENDLSIRTSLRRDEAREQAERHRLQMEMMLDRVTQIPTLFERHSQMQSKLSSKNSIRRKKKTLMTRNSSSTDSYASCGSNSRPNSGSLVSSTGTLISSSQSSKSLESKDSQRSETKSSNLTSKKKTDRGPLKVSINETAELIEDYIQEKDKLSDDSYSDKKQDEDELCSDYNFVEE